MCQICEGEFPKTWTDAEAEAQFVRRMGRKPTEKERTQILCDGCYEKVIAVIVESQGVN